MPKKSSYDAGWSTSTGQPQNVVVIRSDQNAIQFYHGTK